MKFNVRKCAVLCRMIIASEQLFIVCCLHHSRCNSIIQHHDYDETICFYHFEGRRENNDSQVTWHIDAVDHMMIKRI
ncbi:CLUMA_CG001448, isoform A [Clunio marinus]|uniref:CLUMA_CG001448, isoform A n=1 Tax=Clunio marinus TaxID=568069 RepID=A0A1J1HHZ3_9DIPT|nr:CLUMA_CG001448, isoform A [Clunio marinus]